MDQNAPQMKWTVPRNRPDYELDDVQELSEPEQFKALGDPLRMKILGLLRERAATTSQLAQALEVPIGTMGHHLQVLARAGLIRIVRTRQVRAITEKYYGCTARSLVSRSDDQQEDLMRQAMREYVPSPDGEGLPLYLLRHARIPAEQAREFARRLEALAAEFAGEGGPGNRVYGFLGAVYLTDWPELPESRD